uniref:Transposase Tnp1/En/Spm-like domain-containing protein n=1 Tax=Oryza brachyantha TaxID=4533 RepID=J3N0Z5_ORYBR
MTQIRSNHTEQWFTWQLTKKEAELENLIEKQPELAQNDQGRVAWEGDALYQRIQCDAPEQADLQSERRITSMVGSTVILTTVKYRKKECVTYATFLTSNPREKAGGVEIGNEFTKVVVNHPIQENEELVRPLKHCKTIGDAHVAGMSIAWPSICIQKIDG